MAEDRNGFWLLAAGALLFAAVFLFAYQWLGLGETEALDPPVLLGLCTIVFGLPYAAREVLARRTNWLLVGFLILLVPLFHALAAYVFTYVSTQVQEAAARAAEAAAMATDPADMMQPAAEGATASKMFIGLAAGLAGALPLLLAGLLPWLRAPGTRLWPVLAGLVALAWWGGISVRLADIENSWDVAATIFLPWQVLFAFMLAHLLRPSPPKGPAPQ
ncbi:MAG TPA: hypothetical protein VMS43_07290 [Allosphingosinicella sp.]|nr:hypothetical protein [Allosphingosinicella sp.]